MNLNLRPSDRLLLAHPTCRELVVLVEALGAMVPLLAPEWWVGFRLAGSDAVLSVLSATEQPLSVRSPGGVWAMLVTLVWLGLGYRSRRVRLWEAGLVLVGGAAALIRLGNAWLFAAALVVPLARQLRLANLHALVLTFGAAASLAVGGLTLAATQPPALPGAAVEADEAVEAAGTGPRGAVMADWRWAPELQRHLGPRVRVLAAGGLSSESADFWLDYLLIAQGHERWADDLRALNVETVVLDAADQQRAASNLVRGSSDWRVVYDANGALVAERSPP